jgi:hypothetical protein
LSGSKAVQDFYCLLIAVFLLNTKKTTQFDVGNPGLGLEQAQTCDGVKQVSVHLAARF